MRVLLVSTYELGHQPLHVASPAAALERSGHDVTCVDLSVQPWDPNRLTGIDAVAISVPMHTAMRLGLQVAREVRGEHPQLPVCLYGLYAATGHESTDGALMDRGIVDRVIAGEYEPALVAWVGSLDDRADANRASAEGPVGRAPGEPEPVVQLGRNHFEIPARHLLEPLSRYARLAVAGEQRPVGYVEASHGCGFNCRHCPVPAVYGGRMRIVDHDTVIADIDQLVEAGATHITFGDPDFLNGPRHSLRILDEMHRRHPDLTFDCTTKVELILRHRELWPRFADAGCLFVVSAFETVNDSILAILDKGHTRADMVEATEVLRSHGIEVRPSLMPFTPWTTLSDLVELMEFVAEQDLIGNIDPVHYSIRLLVPQGSLLVGHPAMEPHLGSYDPDQLGYDWTPADPATGELQRRIAGVVEEAAADDRPLAQTYGAVRRIVREAAGSGRDDWMIDPAVAAEQERKPRLTEAWFCCAEPTAAQLEPLRRS